MITNKKSSHKPTVLHVGTLNKPITPNQSYAPIETVIHNIDKGLVSRGYRSLVACSGDSQVSGEKHTTVDRTYGGYCQHHSEGFCELIDKHLRETLARAMKGDIDVIHMHEWPERVYDGSFNPPLPIIMTLHVDAKHSGFGKLLDSSYPQKKKGSIYFNAISEYQKREYSDLANIYRVIHHGIDMSPVLPKQNQMDKKYLFSIGRISPLKGQDKAIVLARETGSKLFIAGCVQNKPEDRSFFETLKKSIDLCVDVSQFDGAHNYYESVIKPLLNCGKQIIYIGELNTKQKEIWYDHAKATLFPLQWGEPFGLVAAESMARGTPVLALNRGALPEIVVHRKTGFIVNSMKEMMDKVKYISALDRNACFRHVQTHFSIDRMAQNYSDMYQQVIEENRFKSKGLVWT